MFQLEIPDIRCLNENHTQSISQVCLNNQCTDSRLICQQCLNKGLHQQHLKDVQGLNSLVCFIDNNNKSCDNLGDLVMDSYFKLKNEIKNKYQSSKERLLKMDPNQLNYAISQMISLTDYNVYLSKMIIDISIEQKLKIDKLKQELVVCSIIKTDYITIYNNQKFDDALQVIDQTLKLNPNNRESLWCTGECLKETIKFFMKNNLNEALNWYNKAISVDPKHLNSLSAKGDCLKMNMFINNLRGLGQFNEAIILYDQALSINPKHLDSLYGKGNYFLPHQVIVQEIIFLILLIRELGKYDESLKWLNQALSIQPKDCFSLQSKGVCLIFSISVDLLQEQQKFSEALNCYEQALKISPVDQFIQMRKYKCEQALKKD